MKWSDGHPFTADDIVFSIEDCAKNSELYGSVPSQLTIAGKPVVVSKVDDATVKFTFAAPYATYLETLATPLGQHPTLFAKHYASQFHPKYNDKVDDLVKQANLQKWSDLFRAKNGDIEIPQRWGNPEKPTLDPWVVVEPYVGGTTRVVMKRNPYFWQVDTEGNQLPYIDELYFGISQDVESLLLDAISGKLDIQERHVNLLQNKPTLSQNREKGGYRLIELEPSAAQQCQIYLNICHKDPKLKAFFGKKEVRQALSLGIDRERDHRAGLFRPVRAVPGRAAAEPSLVSRDAGPAVHRARRRQGRRDAGPGRLRQERRQRLPPAPRRQQDLLRHRRHPDPLCRPGRRAGAGEAALGGDRHRHQGQHHRARAVLHPRRQQRP